MKAPQGRWTAAAAGAAAAAALLFAACGSSSSVAGNTGGATTTSGQTTTTAAPSNPASELSALETVPTSNVSLQETGSSLLYPVFSAWASAYHQAWPNITVTGAATGSGTGQSDAISGTVDIGASDAYLPPDDFTAHPDVENIPLAVSAQQVNYNLPTIPASTHLKLSASVLAKMYTGKITSWNDPAVAALNPGVTLPNVAVHPVHRTDSSGDTFLFSSYLSDAAPNDWSLGFNTTISWPSVSGQATGTKNSGMLSACKSLPGCVAYIGISYLGKTTSAGLGEAILQNKSGNFELPTASSIVADVASFTNVPARGDISLIDGPGAGAYPIVNFEYAIVLKTQSGSDKAQAIKSLLAWCMDPSHGSSSTYLSPVNFQPLPPGALQVAINLLKQIS